jgi:HAD superfamily hydrolase (TIGR01549 family)
MAIKMRAFRELFMEEFPERINEIMEHIDRNAPSSRFEKFAYIHDRILKRPITQDRMNELSRRFSEKVIESVLKCSVVDGMPGFLEEHKGRTMYIASNSATEEVRHIAGQLGIDGYFKGIYGSPTPKTENITKIMGDEGVSCGDVLYIGDTSKDFDLARAMGLRFIGFMIDSNRENPFSGNNVRVACGFRELGGMV